MFCEKMYMGPESSTALFSAYWSLSKRGNLGGDPGGDPGVIRGDPGVIRVHFRGIRVLLLYFRPRFKG